MSDLRFHRSHWEIIVQDRLGEELVGIYNVGGDAKGGLLLITDRDSYFQFHGSDELKKTFDMGEETLPLGSLYELFDGSEEKLQKATQKLVSMATRLDITH